MSSFVNIPQAVRTPRGMRATIFELILVILSVIQRRIVPMKVTQTTVDFQFFSFLFEGISSTSFLDLKGKNHWRSNHAIRIIMTT